MELQASELRIGDLINKFKDNESFVSKVTGHDLYLWEKNKTQWTRIEPIPLTKEWILKWGFEKAFGGYTKDISTFKGLEYKHLIIDLDQGIMIRQGRLKEPRQKAGFTSILETIKTSHAGGRCMF